MTNSDTGYGTADAVSDPSPRYIAFAGPRRIASGGARQVALSVKRVVEADPWAPVLVFDASTSERLELDLRGTDQDILARLDQDAADTGVSKDDPAPGVQPGTGTSTGPGRPKLGVVAREVTLLPRHWEWLNSQTGGASVALRKLVEEARRTAVTRDRIRRAREATYRFLSAIAGNLPNFEEATRTLFTGDGGSFETHIAEWPEDIRDHARDLAESAWEKENL